MLKALKSKLIESGLTPAEKKRIDAALLHLNSAGFDNWGLDPEAMKATIAATKWLYRDYFRVENSGIENLPKGRMLLVGNHGGQLPLDGYVISMSLLLDANPARIPRGMVERWAPSVPFVSAFFQRMGQMVGDIRNCKDLLEHDECVLVFPEGVGGSGKPLSKKYQLQKFGTGFVRLALETRSPIVTVAVIGCEEAYPSLHNWKSLAKLLKAPYFPVTPLFPLLGPIGMIPLPCKVTLRYSKPIYLEGDPDAPDREIDRMVDRVRESLQLEIDQGLKLREGKIFTGSAKK